jgi:hypothetical protein
MNLNLRKVALFAAIAQLLALITNILSYIDWLGRVDWQFGDHLYYLITQSASLLAQAMLTLFFFILYAELKRG